MPQVLRMVTIQLQLEVLSPIFEHNKEKSNEKMQLKNRRKVLRLDTPTSLNTGSQHNDEEDPDFVPASNDEVGDAAEGRNRKRCRNQAHG